MVEILSSGRNANANVFIPGVHCQNVKRTNICLVANGSARCVVSSPTK